MESQEYHLLSEIRSHPIDSKFQTLSIFYSDLLINPNHVVIVALNRPEKRNAMNTTMWKEIGQAFNLLGTLGDGCRCILLIGKGKAFCSGIDITDQGFGLMDTYTSSTITEQDPSRKYISFRPKILDMQRALTAIEECPVPIIAAIHGSCIGGGVDLSCCADIRICSPSAIFGIREARLGLAADVGTLQRFPKIVGFGSRVRELCFTGQDFDALEALKMGFVSRISKTEEDLIPNALRVCENIARNSPVAIFGTKLSLNYSRDHSVSEGLDHIATHNAAALMTSDLMNSFLASRQKEKPVYDDLLPHSRL